MYRIHKVDVSHKYLNKSVQLYLDTNYSIRDELRTESFPNTSHSQKAVTVIHCVSHVILALGQSCWSTSSPGVNLNSSPGDQTARTLLGCQAATMASSTYAFFSKDISMDLHLSANFHEVCGNIIISDFQIRLS